MVGCWLAMASYKAYLPMRAVADITRGGMDMVGGTILSISAAAVPQLRRSREIGLIIYMAAKK